ncbi:MAG: transglutaminase family protein [Pirellulales bacterium]
MHYQISHVTRYIYTSPVSVCQNILTLSPRNSHRIQCASHRLRIKPTPVEIHRRTDFFGNHLAVFSIEENHDDLTIVAHSRVAVQDPAIPAEMTPPSWREVRAKVMDRIDFHWLTASHFLYDSPRIERADQYLKYASASFPAEADVLHGTLDLSRRIHSEFKYESGATHSATPTGHAFSIRRGVCQDFAHIMIACLRSIGLSARYVSGYLRTVPPPGQDRLVGADQSHAWVGVYCGPELGWIDFDPTNDCICGKDHIPIAWGRDYSDVVPVRGAFLGGGDSRISVSVDVAPI